MNLSLLNSVTAFVWTEADMLDHTEYDAWLALWSPDGTYIVPIDPDAEDHANTLNYAHDDAEMRRLRAERLSGRDSVSVQPRPRTVRSVSRLRVVKEEGDRVTVRGAQDLHAFRKEDTRQFSADVTWQLRRQGDAWCIERKVVKLVNSTDVLSCVGYIF